MRHDTPTGRDPENEGIWSILKAAAGDRWQQAEDKMRERRAEAAESGRLGGEVHAPSRPTARPARHVPGPTGQVIHLHRREEPDGGESTHREGAAPAGAWAVAKRTFKEFGADHGTLMAAAVAFYLILSLVPLLVVGVAVFAYVMTDDQARGTVINFASQYVPQQREMLTTSLDAVRSARGTLGTIGLLTLALTATSGFATLETAINATWKVPNRNFIWNKLYALGMMFVIGLLLIVSIGITTVVGWAHSIPGLGWLENSVVAPAIGLLLSVAVSGLMFTVIYKYFPNVEVAWKPALISGFLTAVLWEAFKQAYTWYTSSSFQGDQAATYGVLAGFIGLLTWIFYSAALVLLGSELTWVLAGCPDRGQERREGIRRGASEPV